MEVCAGVARVRGAAVVGALQGAVLVLRRLALGEEEGQRAVVALQRESQLEVLRVTRISRCWFTHKNGASIPSPPDLWNVDKERERLVGREGKRRGRQPSKAFLFKGQTPSIYVFLPDDTRKRVWLSLTSRWIAYFGQTPDPQVLNKLLAKLWLIKMSLTGHVSYAETLDSLSEHKEKGKEVFRCKRSLRLHQLLLGRISTVIWSFTI